MGIRWNETNQERDDEATFVGDAAAMAKHPVLVLQRHLSSLSLSLHSLSTITNFAFSQNTNERERGGGGD
jgi:hypothetical protein